MRHALTLVIHLFELETKIFTYTALCKRLVFNGRALKVENNVKRFLKVKINVEIRKKIR